jgi:hypothetical protein
VNSFPPQLRFASAWRNWRVAIVAALVVVAWLPALSDHSIAIIDSGLTRSLLCFAGARTVNGLLSVVQGTQVALQPMGLGLTLSLGQILEPVNRLVEEFSAVMFIAAVSFGVMKTLVVVTAWWPVKLAVTACAVLWAVSYGRNRAHRGFARLLCAMLLLRFAVPVAALGSEFAFQQFLAQDYAHAQASLEGTPAQMEAAAGPEPGKTFIDKLHDGLSAPFAAAKARYSALVSSAQSLVAHLVDLLVVFVLQTVVFPVAFLWLLYRALKLLTTWPVVERRLRSGGDPGRAADA